MAHVIMGLLMIEPSSLYRLIKAFEEGVGLLYSASAGSIKRALDKLLTQGFIEVQSEEEGGRGTKLYRVTEPGRAEFQSWMAAEPTGSSLDNAVLPRLFFLGHMPKVEQGEVLKNLQDRIHSDRQKLVELGDRLDTYEIPEEYVEIATHQRAALVYGIDSGQFMLDWFARYADQIETDR